MSCFCKNLDTTSGPKVNDTPRSFSDQPVISLSGSDHRRSHRRPSVAVTVRTQNIGYLAYKWISAPVSGTSVGLMTRRICSIDCRSGLRPPCIVNIFSSMIAAIGKQLKQSVNVFHSLMLYRRLPMVRCVSDTATQSVVTHIRHRTRKFC